MCYANAINYISDNENNDSTGLSRVRSIKIYTVNKKNDGYPLDLNFKFRM